MKRKTVLPFIAGAAGLLLAHEPPKTFKNSLGLELVLIPAGAFDIGSLDSVVCISAAGTP